MIDSEVERVCQELTTKQNPAGVEAVLKVALYYTEKLAVTNVGKTIVVEKKIETRPNDESKSKTSHASDDVDEFSDAMTEAEKNLGLPPA